jgi:translocation and assembly module TamB
VILRISRWVIRVFVVVAFACVSAALWLLTTESGTRFLLSKAEPWIPEELSITGISGSLIGGLGARSIEWRSESFRLSANAVDVDVNLIELWALNIGADSMRVRSLDMAVMPQDNDGGEPFDGFVSPIPVSITDADITAFSLDLGDTPFSARDVRISASLEEASLQARLYLNSDMASGNIEGAGSLIPPYAFDVALTRMTTNFADGFETRETDLSIAGTIERYEFEGVSGVTLFDGPDAFVELTGSGDLSRAELTLFSVDTNSGSAEGSGQVTWRPEISWDVAFDAAGVDIAQFRPGVDIVADVAGRASGTWSDETVRDGRVTIDSYAARYEGFIVAGSGDLTIDGDIVGLSDVALGAEGFDAVVNGRAAPSFNLQIDAESSDLSTLVAETRGALNASARITGSPSAPEIAGTAHAEMIGWRDVEADRMDVTFDVGTEKPLDIRLSSEVIDAYGQAIDTIAIDVTGWLAEHEIRARLERGDAALSMQVDGGYGEDEWRGSLARASLDGERLGAWRLQNPAAARLSAATSELAEACLKREDSDGLICASLGLITGDKSTFAVTIEDLPLAGLPLALPDTVDVRGRVYLDSAGAYDDDGVDGEFALDIRGAAVSTEFEGEVETVGFSQLGGDIEVIDDALTAGFAFGFAGDFGGGDLNVELASVRDLEAPMSGNASLMITDLSALAVLMPDIDDATGLAEGRIDITGTPAVPVITGRLALIDGGFRVPIAGIDVTDVQIEVGQTQPGSLSVSGHAMSGEGRLRIDGRTYIDSVDGLATELEISGENVEIVRLPDLSVQASPDVRLFVNDGVIEATGTLLIPRADVRAQTLPETAERPSRDTIVVGREEEGTTTRRAVLDVEVRLGDDVSLDAFGLSTALEGGLRLRASPDSPLTGSGRINLREGRFEAYGQDLEVDRGELFFNGPLTNPLFDVRAVRRVTNVSAGIHVTGTPGRFNSELYSDPPMSEAETLSYLLTGRPLTVADTNDGDLMNQAAFALGVSQAGAITSQVRTSLGLETLTVEGTLDDSRIIAGTRIGGRLLVEYGYGLADQLGTLILKYQLNERLTLESSTGTVSTIDLKYNVRRK